MADVKMNGKQSNVLCSLLGKYSDVRKAFLAIFLLSLYFEIHCAEECDFVKCITGVRSYIFDLSLKKASFNCRKLSDIQWCSEYCMHRYFPNAFSHSEGQQGFVSYCEENISNRLSSNWSCIAKHSFRLFACLANVNSLTTNNVRDDIMLTETCSSCLCRKYVEFQNCPKQVLLADCGQESSNVIKDLVLFVLDNYQPVSCKGANVKEVLALPVHYHLGSDYVEASKFLDEHNSEVRNCLTQYIQDEIDLDGFFCGGYEPRIGVCVNYELNKNGKSYPDVKKLLFKIIALSGFKCKQSSLQPETVSSSHASESEKTKSDDHPSLKDGTVAESVEISTSRSIEIYNYDSKLTPESSTYAKTDVQKDSSAVNKINKVVNVNDSDVKNSQKLSNQNVYSENMCSGINVSIFMFIFCFSFLFIFR